MTAAQQALVVPEPGQLIAVRGSHWVVTDVVPDSLPAEVVSLRGSTSCTLVRLSNVGDDAMGEELEVFWEREPGARVEAASTLPQVQTGEYDDLGVMAAFLDAVRWGASASADIAALQAPFRSGVRVEDYQLDPVVRALGATRANLLLADDVGLGKTIEAGLVAQEMLMRQRARRVMVVAPADLTGKWQREMADKFGLRFHIVNAESVRELRRERGIDTNPWRVWPLTIVSLQWLRGDRAQRTLEEVLGPPDTYPRFFDLLIVDEAHHLAPSADGRYAVDTQQTRAMMRLAPHAENRLFLTATPHNGHKGSFAALLSLLDPQRFTRGAEPNAQALEEAMVRRVKSDIRTSDGSARFTSRVTLPIEVSYTDVDREGHDLLQRYVAARAAMSSSKQAADMITLLLKKRLFSSPAAFAHTLDVHAASLARRRGPATVVDLSEQMDLVEDDYGDEAAKEAAEAEALDLAARGLGASTAEQDDALAKLRAWAQRYGQSTDAKATELLAWLQSTLRPDGVWNDERVVIFTEYRDTQAWLVGLLTAAGLGGDRLRLIFGGQDEAERERAKDAFQAPPDRDPVRILLATDAASEGIDLQKHCHRMVLYDIPFNPNRLEQRIGRLDRYGQRHDVQVLHFVGSGWQDANPGSYENDLEFLSRIAVKITSIREDLGKVNRLISTAIEDHMTGRTTRVAVDAVTANPGKDLLKFERSVRERIDTAREALAETVEHLRISPENITHVTAVGLELAGQPPLSPVEDIPGAWWVGKRSGVWRSATDGLADPLTGEERPITFDPEVAAHHDGDVVLAHLNHPLVAHATRLLRSQVWGSTAGTDRGLHRVAALRVSDDLAGGDIVVAAFNRLVVAGADGSRLHEEVFAAGGQLVSDGARWERLTVGRLENILNEALDRNDAVRDATLADTVAAEWSRWSDRLTTAIDARASERVESLTKKLDARRDAEISRIETVLTGLAEQIRTQLAPDPAVQLNLFDIEEEGTQYVADRAAWQARLDEIPAEIARETEAVRHRYTDVRHFVFPAAVIIAVPDSLDGHRS